MVSNIFSAGRSLKYDHLFEAGATDTTAPARLRTYSVIPDSSGDSTDALTYSGDLKAASEIVKGTATTTDGWKTCTFEKSAQ